jgi:hypothetical protein
MTVATGVEVRSSGVAEPAPILRAGWNLGRGAAAADGSASAPPAQSFQSNWQTQFASLGSGAGIAGTAQKSGETERLADDLNAGNGTDERPAFNEVLSPPLKMPEARQPGLLQTNSIASYGTVQRGPTNGRVGVEQQGPAAGVKETGARQSGPVARPERPNKTEKEKPEGVASSAEKISLTHDFVLPAVSVTVGAVPVSATPVLRHSPELFSAFAKTPSGGESRDQVEPAGRLQIVSSSTLQPRAVAQQASDARPDASSELQSSPSSKDANQTDDLTIAVAAQTGESAPAIGPDARSAPNVGVERSTIEAPIAAGGPNLVLNSEAGLVSSTVSPLSSQAVPVQAPEAAGLAGGISASPIRRATREAVTAVPAGHGGIASPAQFAAGPGDATGLMHDPQGALRGEAGSVAANVNGTAAPALRETFSALDAEAAPGAPALTHATGRQVEAGFQDPALGWIGVRADLSGGGVHASLVPDSAASAQELGRHMDGINNYLAEQHTPVASLGMAAPNSQGADSSAGDGFGQGTQHGTQHGSQEQTQQGTSQDAQQQFNAERQQERGINGESSNNVILAQSSGAVVEVGNSIYSAGGSHISVMA